MTTILVPAIIFTLCIKLSTRPVTSFDSSFYYPGFSSNDIQNVPAKVNLILGYNAQINDITHTLELTNANDPLCKNAPLCRGGAVRSQPIEMYVTKDGVAMSFTCIFTFQLLSSSTKAGKGLLFLLTASPFSDSTNGEGEYFGIFPYEGAPPKYTTWGVEFDTYKDPEIGDQDDNHVGVNFNTGKSLFSRSANDINLNLWGTQITAWIQYNDPAKSLDIRISSTNQRPSIPFLVLSGMDMRSAAESYMYVGFMASGIEQSHTILSWSFQFSNSTSSPPQFPQFGTGTGSPPTRPAPPIPDPPPPPVDGVTLITSSPAEVAKGSGLTLMGAFVFFFILIGIFLRFTAYGQTVLLKMWNGLVKVKHLGKLLQTLGTNAICVKFCSLDEATRTTGEHDDDDEEHEYNEEDHEEVGEEGDHDDGDGDNEGDEEKGIPGLPPTPFDPMLGQGQPGAPAMSPETSNAPEAREALEEPDQPDQPESPEQPEQPEQSEQGTQGLSPWSSQILTASQGALPMAYPGTYPGAYPGTYPGAYPGNYPGAYP